MIKTKKEMNLTASQKSAVSNYRNILDTIGLDIESTIDRTADDPEALVPVVKSMTEQVVRSEVITMYTWIDSTLDNVLFTHLAGKNQEGRHFGKRRRHTLDLILRRLYPLQKLSIIRTFKKVPKDIVSIIGAPDELRNGLAHNFFVFNLPKESKNIQRP